MTSITLFLDRQNYFLLSRCLTCASDHQRLTSVLCLTGSKELVHINNPHNRAGVTVARGAVGQWLCDRTRNGAERVKKSLFKSGEAKTQGGLSTALMDEQG